MTVSIASRRGARDRRSLLRWACIGPALGMVLAIGEANAGDRPVSPEGLEILRSGLRSQFGRLLSGDAPVLRAETAVDHYRITVDLTGVARMAPGLRIDPPSVVLRAVEQDDDLWRVVIEAWPNLSASGVISLEDRWDGFRSAFFIDPRTRSVRASEAIWAGRVERRTNPDGTSQTSTESAGAANSRTWPSAVSGAIDGHGDWRSTSMKVVVNAPAPPGTDPQSAPVLMQFAVDRAVATTSLVGLRSTTLLEALALLLDPRDGAGDAARKMASRAAPFFDSLTSRGEIRGLDATIAGVRVQVDSIVQSQGLAREAGGSRIDADLSIKGLAAGGYGVADWHLAMVPRELRFVAGSTGFDPAAFLVALLNHLPSQSVAIAMVPSGAVSVRLPVVELSGTNYRLEGEATFDMAVPDFAPKARATIRMTGLDAVIKTITVADYDPAARGAASILLAAKTLGQVDTSGGVRWEIAWQNGVMTVNGNRLP